MPTKCLSCGHAYDRDAHERCPNCRHASLEEFGGGD